MQFGFSFSLEMIFVCSMTRDKKNDFMHSQIHFDIFDKMLDTIFPCPQLFIFFLLINFFSTRLSESREIQWTLNYSCTTIINYHLPFVLRFVNIKTMSLWMLLKLKQKKTTLRFCYYHLNLSFGIITFSAVIWKKIQQWVYFSSLNYFFFTLTCPFTNKTRCEKIIIQQNIFS